MHCTACVYHHTCRQRLRRVCLHLAACLWSLSTAAAGACQRSISSGSSTFISPRQLIRCSEAHSKFASAAHCLASTQNVVKQLEVQDGLRCVFRDAAVDAYRVSYLVRLDVAAANSDEQVEPWQHLTASCCKDQTTP
eukprot:16920-Heterococcus_DN1.PRE.3